VTDDALLLMRLAGPLQSWGINSEFNSRRTAAEPTKSGIVGLLAAALGRNRDQPIHDLTALRLGVRTDQAGTRLRDYHTASDHRGQPLLSAQVDSKGRQKRTAPPKPTQVTQRYYLQDALFIAACEGPRTLLDELDHALKAPAYPLALGRRSCPPAGPVSLGVRDASGGDDALLDLLNTHPWAAGGPARAAYAKTADTPDRIAVMSVLETADGPHTLTDVPASFHPLHRRLTDRRVRHLSLTVPTGLAPRPEAPGRARKTGGPGHDPFALLGW
jgi:CRISPR system Cascade subunit CasD